MDGVRVRPVTAADREFLYRVYAASRADELSVLDWSEAKKAAFLRQQFDAQDTHYKTHFPSAQFDVLELEGVPIGRLYVDRGSVELRIMDIALLPEHRGRGIGSALLGEILEEATRAGTPVRLHVEPTNPARRLYLRLGFVEIAEQGAYLELAYLPIR